MEKLGRAENQRRSANFTTESKSFSLSLEECKSWFECSVAAVVERLKKCRICGLRHAKPKFTLPMWNTRDGHAERSRICIDCENNAPRCIRCNSLKKQSDFTTLEWQKGKERYTCFACQESKRKRQERALKKCNICKEYFPEESFMPTQWSKQRQRTCKTCTQTK